MEEQLIQVLREGLYLVLLTSAPPVLASLITGLLLSIVQATTQIQEQSLSFAPKAVAVFLSLLVAGPWIGAQLVRFAVAVFEGIAFVG